jgi:glutamyl-tRNA synthetase
MAERLVSEGRAYYCYCTPETLQAKREAAEAAEGGWKYDRTCCHLAPDRIREMEASGAPRAVRFKVPPGETRFDDQVHGPIAFDNANIEDFVVLRSDRQPTYHLSVVADDIDMEITHVVRGDDHISNTPKQALLYGAFGRPAPKFAHVPLILGPDRKRLSKRHGATSVMEYQRLGYLSAAMVNFLALLGWSPGNDQELFTRDELIGAFSLEGISGGNAVFNPEKLDWFNQQYLLHMTDAEVARLIEPFLTEAGLWRPEYATTKRQRLLGVVALLKPRVRRLTQFVEDGSFFFEESIQYDPAAVAKHLSAPGSRAHLEALRTSFETVEPFNAAPLEAAVRALAEHRHVKAGTLIHATRVVVTGRAASPGLFEVLELLGRERSLSRVDRALPLATA